MIRSAKFWASMALFQVVFGLGVFAVTRQYYLPDTGSLSADLATVREPVPAWPTAVTNSDLVQQDSLSSGEISITDPAEISRQADEFFNSKQYDRAAELYEQLLAIDPNNVGIYNNLGITLHYLGRSNEALDYLDQGVTLDPGHQRTWLTLGFVNRQLGNVERARSALTTAAQMEADSAVRQTAAQMLEDLP